MYISSQEIQNAIKKVVDAVEVYRPEVLLLVLMAAQPFALHLLEGLKKRGLVLEVNSLRAHRNEAGEETIRIVPELFLPRIYARKVLLVDCIWDTGKTMQACIDYLEEESLPAEVRTAVLLWRNDENSPVVLRPDYYGIDLQGAPGFLYGFGLDLNGEKRELPYIETAPDSLAQDFVVGDEDGRR